MRENLVKRHLNDVWSSMYFLTHIIMAKTVRWDKVYGLGIASIETTLEDLFNDR